MNSKKIRTIGAVLLAVLVLVYVGYQGYLATHRSIQTETAMYGQVSDVLQPRALSSATSRSLTKAPTACSAIGWRTAPGWPRAA